MSHWLIRPIFVLSVLAACIALPSSVRAQTASIPIQGQLNNSGGAPINGVTPITFRVYRNGNLAHTLSNVNVNVSKGLFSTTLEVPGNIVDGASLSVTLEVDGDGEMGEIPIKAVPYAYWSENASKLGGLAAGQYLQVSGGTVDSLVVSGGLRLSSGAGNGRVLTSDGSGNASWQSLNVSDADANPSNELQTLSISGNTLSLSLGGGSVSLPSGADNLGNHIATTNLNLNNLQLDNVSYVDVRAGNGYGLRFWSSDSYKISMGNSGEYRYGPVADYSIKFGMNNDGDRGWTWGVNGLTPVMGLATSGAMQLAGTLTVSAANAAGGGLRLSDAGGLFDRNDGYGSLAFSNGVDFEDAQDTGDHLQVLFNDSYPEVWGYRNGSSTLVEFRTGMYNNGGTFYSQNQMYARAGLANDQGDLLINDNVNVTGNICFNGDCRNSWAAVSSATRTGSQQINTGGLTSYSIDSGRYHLEVTPARVGRTVAVNHTILQNYCGDQDGCEFWIGMRNWTTGQPNNVASRGPYRLFYNISSGWWRISNGDWSGLDGNGGNNEINFWDCYFGDSERSNGSSNQRSDNARGFGFLNCRGCGYSDTTTTCTLTIDD